MSELLSAIEGFRAETLPELPDARIEEDFAELHKASELIELERLRRLAEIDRRRLYERDGTCRRRRGSGPPIASRTERQGTTCGSPAGWMRCR
jgi:hypothetical protein